MKTDCHPWLFTLFFAAAPLGAQPAPHADALAERANQLATNAPAGYAPDFQVVRDAQEQALAQAREMEAHSQNATERAALEKAIQEMERARTALAAAAKSPDQLPAAIAAEQAAFQALLKATPHEIRMSRSRTRGQSQGRSAGEPDQRQADQLDATPESNRYETERQAQAAPNARQREQTQVADRLKELAQRQQDLNDRMRELQTALQAAHTDRERADIQNQLKRLDDEQRQMVANVDEMRQQLAQSPNAGEEAGARQQLEQARNDMQRASEELRNQSASQALAAGTRAQQNMQNLRDDLRRQTAGEFTDQMRQLRSQARDMANRENEIARALESLNQGGNHSLDDSAPRTEISRQMARQESGLTNLMAGLKELTERAEATEPLLAKQLYENLRRADQRHTDNLLEMGAQLVDRGFLPQASEVERTTHTNITELTEGVTRAADSVLGSQADALRYAQKELDDLSRQLAREAGGAAEAEAHDHSARGNAPEPSNHLVRTEAGGLDTNATQKADVSPRDGTTQLAENDAQGQPGGDGNSPPRDRKGNSAAHPNGGTAQGTSNAPGTPPDDSGPGNTAAANNADGATGTAAGVANEAQRLRRLAEQLGRDTPATDAGGPITGNDYAAWSQQLRDVESVLDSPDLRNQLATVRDRVGALRAAYRNGRRAPSAETVRQQLLLPLTQVQTWVREELAREDNSGSLAPLDRDPVPEHYAELVRQYYEKLGSAQ